MAQARASGGDRDRPIFQRPQDGLGRFQITPEEKLEVRPGERQVPLPVVGRADEREPGGVLARGGLEGDLRRRLRGKLAEHDEAQVRGEELVHLARNEFQDGPVVGADEVQQVNGAGGVLGKAEPGQERVAARRLAGQVGRLVAAGEERVLGRVPDPFIEAGWDSVELAGVFAEDGVQAAAVLGGLEGLAFQVAVGNNRRSGDKAALEEVQPPVELDSRGPEVFPAEVEQMEILNGETALRPRIADRQDTGEGQVLRLEQEWGERPGPVLDLQHVGCGVKAAGEFDQPLGEQHGRWRVEAGPVRHLSESPFVS